MEYISNDNRKFIFKFEIKNEEKLIITAQEENKDKITPDIYKQEFTKDELSDRKKNDMIFGSFEKILQQINISFEKGTAAFNVDSSEITLSYLLFNNLKVDLQIKVQNYKEDFFNLKNDIKGYFGEQKEEINSIKDILNHKFKKENSIDLQSCFTINNKQKSLESDLLYKPIEDISKIKIIDTIKDEHSNSINSICELKDKRLVSCSDDKSIIVFDKSYKPQIKIQNAHDGRIFSLCVLRNGELVSSSSDNKVKVWRINENDYKLIHTLIGHSSEVRKVIELKDGRISSCCEDKTIRIWDNYKCIQTLKGHTSFVRSIIEMKNHIISGSSGDNTLRIWDESTYQCIKIINDVRCWSWNGLSKVNDNTLLVGGSEVIYVVDIQTYKVKKIEAQSSGDICCFNVLKNGLIILGNEIGEICCTDISSDIIIFRKKLHDDNSCVWCLIESEDKLISCSNDKTIKIYKEV